VVPGLLQKLQTEELASQIEKLAETFSSPFLIRSVLTSVLPPPQHSSTTSASSSDDMQAYEEKLNKNVVMIERITSMLKKDRIIKYARLMEKAYYSIQKIQRFMIWWKKYVQTKYIEPQNKTKQNKNTPIYTQTHTPFSYTSFEKLIHHVLIKPL
jgi:hypothetical protein